MKTDPLALQAERRILLIRRQRVMLDYELAALYGVEARALNQAVKRNLARFPSDFMFQLTQMEADAIRSVASQSMIPIPARPSNSSQTVMSSGKHRGRSYRPYAFTEQGVAMLSSVLRSPRAVQVNIAIMRTFVQLRRLMDSNALLAEKIEALEEKYAEHDQQFQLVFDAIKQLISTDTAAKASPAREIGFYAP